MLSKEKVRIEVFEKSFTIVEVFLDQLPAVCCIN
jgi:hypothetical protein